MIWARLNSLDVAPEFDRVEAFLRRYSNLRDSEDTGDGMEGIMVAV